MDLFLARGDKTLSNVFPRQIFLVRIIPSETRSVSSEIALELITSLQIIRKNF